jgi:hypothetical protein
MPDRSKGRSHTKCNRWSSKLGVGRAALDPHTGKIYCYKASRDLLWRIMEEAKTHIGL